MREQVGWGFASLCNLIKVPFKDNKIQNSETLDSFIEKFLSNPEVLVCGSVSHFFYDRAHLEAALEQDTLIEIGNIEYSYQDIFRAMVNKIVTNPCDYPECAKEQLYLRFTLVENDLLRRYPAEYLASQVENTAPNPHSKTEAVLRFNGLLGSLLAKVGQFAKDKETAANLAASDLYHELYDASVQYFNSAGNTGDYEAFKKSCDDAIQPAREVLQHHRGWKDFFTILTLTIVSLGTIPACLAAISKVQTGHWAFRLFETDSSKKLNAIEETVKSLSPTLSG